MTSPLFVFKSDLFEFNLSDHLCQILSLIELIFDLFVLFVLKVHCDIFYFLLIVSFNLCQHLKQLLVCLTLFNLHPSFKDPLHERVIFFALALRQCLYPMVLLQHVLGTKHIVLQYFVGC